MRCRCGGYSAGYVYRLFDSDDRLLYIGATSLPRERFKEHKKTKPWWPDVARTEIVGCECRCAAFRQEVAEQHLMPAVYSPPHSSWSRRGADGRMKARAS